MSNVKSIHGTSVPGQPVPEVVDLLEDMLEEARSGSLRSVAMVGVKESNEVLTYYHSEDNFFTLLGGVACLQSRLTLAVI